MHIHRILLVSAAALLAGCASNRTQGESPVCEVHHARMSKTTVPIHYGLLSIGDHDSARDAVSTNAFPHAKEWVGGGCLVPMFPSRRAVIYTCAVCKIARQQWEHDYDTKQ
ncbi:MAG TPA: hypothetical protein VGE41_03110 [Verrucomicrobiae bacterium]|jgi:hypothetical protein